MSKRIEVGNFEEVKRRNYWWNDMYVCYTGLNSKPFKVDENNYQIKCICNAGGITVNKFKTVSLPPLPILQVRQSALWCASL